MKNNNIYLIAKYVARPKDPKQTSKAGYMKDPNNVQYDEQVYIARGLKDKDLRNHVILDLTGEKIVKNTFKSGVTFEEVFKHFYDGYASYIDDSVNQLTAK
jgi:hypothetical protein